MAKFAPTPLVDPNPVGMPSNLLDLLMVLAEKYPTRTAIRYAAWGKRVGKRETEFTFPELLQSAIQTANLFNGMFIGPGNQVATYLPNRPEFLISGLGAMLSGAWMPLQPNWETGAVTQLIQQQQTKVFIALGQGKGYSHWNEIAEVKDRLSHLKYILTVDPDSFGPVFKETRIWKWLYRKPLQLAPSQAVWDFHKSIFRYQTLRLDSRRTFRPDETALALTGWEHNAVQVTREISHGELVSGAIRLAESISTEESPVFWSSPAVLASVESLLGVFACWWLGGEVVCFNSWSDFTDHIQPSVREYWIATEPVRVTPPFVYKLPKLPGAKVFAPDHTLDDAGKAALEEQFGWKIVGPMV